MKSLFCSKLNFWKGQVGMKGFLKNMYFWALKKTENSKILDWQTGAVHFCQNWQHIGPKTNRVCAPTRIYADKRMRGAVNIWFLQQKDIKTIGLSHGYKTTKGNICFCPNLQKLYHLSNSLIFEITTRWKQWWKYEVGGDEKSKQESV